MNLIDKIARLIDSEGAFSEAYKDSLGSEKHIFTVRQKYYQSKYNLIAGFIAALAVFAVVMLFQLGKGNKSP